MAAALRASTRLVCSWSSAAWCDPSARFAVATVPWPEQPLKRMTSWQFTARTQERLGYEPAQQRWRPAGAHFVRKPASAPSALPSLKQRLHSTARAAVAHEALTLFLVAGGRLAQLARLLLRLVGIGIERRHLRYLPRQVALHGRRSRRQRLVVLRKQSRLSCNFTIVMIDAAGSYRPSQLARRRRRRRRREGLNWTLYNHYSISNRMHSASESVGFPACVWPQRCLIGVC